VSLRHGEEAPPLSSGFPVTTTEAPPQRHREQSPVSSSAQPSEIIASGNPSPPHSRRSLFTFLPAERALTFCMQEEIISRLLCMHTVID